MNRWPLAALAAAALLTAGCGDDDGKPAATTTAAGTDLGAIKTYLLEHTARLQRDAGTIRSDAEAYYALAKSTDFDYRALLADKSDEVKQLVTKLQTDFTAANPAYEEMEGVVAGVPSLADFDVIIDAGGDASDPENAVPFSVKTPAGRTFKQPGNYNYLIETSVFGTEPKFQAEGVDARYGNAVPDADFLVAAARDFAKSAEDLDAAAKAWTPTPADAFNAVVVMTPTMSEYFEAWKNSRAIAGSKATEKAFVAASRLQDIADILGGLVLIYDNIQPTVAKADAAQATQTAKDLTALERFAARLRDAEAGGKSFSAQDADTLGGEAQDRAEAIAGQVSQAAGRLKIQLAE
jgi:hypothetical protein